jgi:hypothetical protein
MSDLERQLREHYQSQELPATRARAILDAGRKAGARTRGRRWILGLAALLVIGWGLGEWVRRTQFRDATPARILPEQIAATVQAFFSQPDYELPQVSSVPAELAAWLRGQGAPASFVLPPAFANLSSFGCRVFDIQGERVYLICFFLDGAGDPAVDGMMKKQMVVTAPDGTMMKKDRPLVHLVFAPRSAFREAPSPGSRVQLPPSGDWNFQTWSGEGLVYLVAGTISADRLAEFAAAN